MRTKSALSYFNPLTPCGVRRHLGTLGFSILRFQSTHPMRGETAFMPGIARAMAEQWGFQSTHPMRGETTYNASALATNTAFQSTHPMRGETPSGTSAFCTLRFQSTHPMRGETHDPQRLGKCSGISIHSPHAG